MLPAAITVVTASWKPQARTAKAVQHSRAPASRGRAL